MGSFNHHIKKFNRENRVLSKDDRKSDDDVTTTSSK